MPVFLLLLLPALAPLLPGITLRTAIVLLPIANLSLAVRDILVGSFDWPMIFIAWVTTLLAAAGVARATVRLLSKESRITATESDAIDFHGGEALFSRKAPTWFAVMWALLLIISNIAPKLDIRIQLIINLVVIFFGGSVLMIRKYNLDPRAALALRFPKPIVFLAVLIGVPGGMLSGVGLYRLASLVFPVPEKMMEDFASALLPANMGMVQIVFFMAVLPGIFEEIAFRGLLLHSLRRRLHPALLVVVVGIVFGFFHMAFFRLAPTAFLGILLACVTLLTGSIFPAMLWHILNNAAALLSDTQNALTQLDSTQYLAGPVLLACTFWILWKNRTPYPDLRPWRRQRPTGNSR
jgi:sodium transport system permease protein